MIATIEIEFQSPETAKRILDAILPDNYPLPPGLSIECAVNGANLHAQILCERGIESLGATLEDILSSIDLSMRTSATVDTKDE